ncbi:hypothetical protein D9Q98_009054 [Chlorella vulgaris]|uniref:Serine/threonine-protein kinase 19 n=1 Tax=Chlorella vulgaris TaxID=3077 RepID=A0A9D4YTI3_CHLVU|nr:hypothetical protein D9Q98_009054 [Chlorella vulgaris]
MSKLRLALPQPPPKRRRTREHVQHWAPTSSDVAAPSSPTNVDFIEEAAPEALPNDTLTALHLLKSRFPAEAAVTPFASRSQLYSVLADRTLADRQLEELRRTAAIRLLQLPASRDECAVVLAGDYAAAVQRCKAGLEEKQQQQSGAASSRTSGSTSMDLDVFDWFAERVLPRCSEVMITHRELVQLLGTAPGAARPLQPRQQAAPVAVTDHQVSLLLNQGLLTRHTGGPDGYLFSMPNAGLAVRSVAAGRQEILGLLQRRHQPEVLEAALLKRKLQRSVLGVRWHVADMIGGGSLLRISTAVGPVLRAAKRGG